jgi:hypothetical protein
VPNKIIACACLLISIATTSAAQDDGPARRSIGIGIKLLAPTGDFSKGWKSGVGIGVVGETRIRPMLALSAEASYNRFASKTQRVSNIEIEGVDIEAWQITGGLKYFVRPSVYLGVEAGYFFMEFVNPTGPDNDIDDSGVSDEPGVLPTIGIKAKWLDLSVQYKLAGDANWVLVRGSFPVFQWFDRRASSRAFAFGEVR